MASKLWEKEALFGAQGGVQNSVMVDVIISMEHRDKFMRDQKVGSKRGKS